jgi:hypothetical protein
MPLIMDELSCTSTPSSLQEVPPLVLELLLLLAFRGGSFSPPERTFRLISLAPWSSFSSFSLSKQPHPVLRTRASSSRFFPTDTQTTWPSSSGGSDGAAERDMPFSFDLNNDETRYGMAVRRFRVVLRSATLTEGRKKNEEQLHPY